MKKLIFILFIVITINKTGVFAQTICPDTTLWTSNTEEYSLTDFFYYNATVDYKTGTVNDQSGSHTAVIIDWSTLDNNIPILRTVTLKHLIELDIVSQLITYPSGTPEQTVYVYYESECKTTVSLWLNLAQTAELDCCDAIYPDPDGAINKVVNGQTYRTKQITKEVSCGVKCCARVYTGGWYQDSLDYIWRFSLTSLNRVSITDCNSTATYYDCDGNPLPCTSSCYDPTYDE